MEHAACWGLMDFFIKGNEMSYQKLKEVLE